MKKLCVLYVLISAGSSLCGAAGGADIFYDPDAGIGTQTRETRPFEEFTKGSREYFLESRKLISRAQYPEAYDLLVQFAKKLEQFEVHHAGNLFQHDKDALAVMKEHLNEQIKGVGRVLSRTGYWRQFPEGYRASPR